MESKKYMCMSKTMSILILFIFLFSCNKVTVGPEGLEIGCNSGYYQNYLTLKDLGNGTLGIKTTCTVPYHVRIYTTQWNTLESEFYSDHPCMSSINTMQKSYKVIMNYRQQEKDYIETVLIKLK